MHCVPAQQLQHCHGILLSVQCNALSGRNCPFTPSVLPRMPPWVLQPARQHNLHPLRCWKIQRSPFCSHLRLLQWHNFLCFGSSVVYLHRIYMPSRDLLGCFSESRV